MILSPDSFMEICKQSAFISALISGFSFAFLGVLIVSAVESKLVDWVLMLTVVTIAGLLICCLAWTLSSSRLALLAGSGMHQVPAALIRIHKVMSLLFMLSFIFFSLSLGLSGWIRSKTVGIVSSLVAGCSLVGFFLIVRNFIV